MRLVSAAAQVLLNEVRRSHSPPGRLRLHLLCYGKCISDTYEERQQLAYIVSNLFMIHFLSSAASASGINISSHG